MDFSLETSFIFLGEKLVSKAGSETELCDGHILKRPNKSQLDTLDKFIKGNFDATMFFNPYRDYKFKKQGDGFVISNVSDLQHDLWIIEPPHDSRVWYFEHILNLSSKNLTCIYEKYITAKGKTGFSSNLYRNNLLTKVYYNDFSYINKEKKIIDDEYIEELKSISQLIRNHLATTEDPHEIRNIMGDFLKLKEISISSPFRFLGYFSILESLLTHNNDRNDSFTSISYQLQTKLELINNRLNNPINFRSYLKVPDSDKFGSIIGKLYQYRSNIAHGNNSDFDKKLQTLKNQIPKAKEFIHDLTRSVILLLLKEPQLLKDLKKC